MKLVDDYDVEVIRWNVLAAVGRERLDAGEDMLPPLGPGAVDILLPERAVVQCLAIGAQGLVEDLAPMGHEEQGQITELLA